MQFDDSPWKGVKIHFEKANCKHFYIQEDILT